jgi:hypothetical protein
MRVCFKRNTAFRHANFGFAFPSLMQEVTVTANKEFFVMHQTVTAQTIILSKAIITAHTIS